MLSKTSKICPQYYQHSLNSYRRKLNELVVGVFAARAHCGQCRDNTNTPAQCTKIRFIMDYGQQLRDKRFVVGRNSLYLINKRHYPLYSIQTLYLVLLLAHFVYNYTFIY